MSKTNTARSDDADLFGGKARKGDTYTAADIEVLEGLEAVRRRPGMYIGGTDEKALHHLFAEVLDNSIDEVTAGHASRIKVEVHADGSVSVEDNGRGIPVDPHPKYPGKSALEIIFTVLHSGGKFSKNAYKTSSGLHGVGASVVNALSDSMTVEVARGGELFRQAYGRGKPLSKLEKVGTVNNRRGTLIRFRPDPQIFGAAAQLDPQRLWRMTRAKAFLIGDVEIRWTAEKPVGEAPAEAVLHFPGGLLDFMTEVLSGRHTVTAAPFNGRATFDDDLGRVEWCIAWADDGDGSCASYVNTVPTSEGGPHESGLRSALARGLKEYGDRVGHRRAAQITAEDVAGSATILLSLFLRDAQFQGQTKEKLATPEAARLVETALKDHFDHWLVGAPDQANRLLARIVERAEERLRRKQEKEVGRKTATRKLRLPGKLADCSRDEAQGTEIFIVEGDSAGGSAKQARSRETQAILPLRGKILNVASASTDKFDANAELTDLLQALGCGTGQKYRDEDLRYEKVIIMTDADVDGAHIASLLMTFFYRKMPRLIENGHLYLALPPLYRLSQGGKTIYARDDAHKDALLKSDFRANAKVEISRFKGLGEMPPAQLKETTMDPRKRVLLRVEVPADAIPSTEDRVESLMGRKPELRFRFIQENATFAGELDV